MAKKSSTVFYCGFCDMTLAKSEGIVYDTIHYCNDLCLKMGKKTSVKDESLNALRHNLNVLRSGVSRQDIKQIAKEAYESLRESYQEMLAENNPEYDYSMYKLTLCVYGHIHNGNKEKAVKSLGRFNDWTSETFEKMCVNSDEISTRILIGDEKETFVNEESVRVSGIIYKLQREIFKLMIDLM